MKKTSSPPFAFLPGEVRKPWGFVPRESFIRAPHALRADLHPNTRKPRVLGTPGLRHKEGFSSLLTQRLPLQRASAP